MIIGIVGSEESKFTEKGKLHAIQWIKRLIADPTVTGVASGECHLGGIDIWAHEVTVGFGKRFYKFPPLLRQWEGGYKQRNIQIAQCSEVVYCISVDQLPRSYNGMRFEYCYHCDGDVLNPPNHIKSGGCWTTKYARKLGKHGILIVVRNDE
jgi:hypothetical protein